MTTIIKISAVIFACLTVLTVVTYLVINANANRSVENNLKKFVSRVKNDLTIKNNNWDTTRYNADPETPHPHGSGGFASPLYIITSEGYVIERSNPIDGFLDSSDYKRLTEFINPKTISPVSNESWRIMSKPYSDEKYKAKILAVAAWFNPDSNNIENIDSVLTDNLDYIVSHLNSTANGIDVSSIDIRQTHYAVTFEIVDVYNRMMLNNGRMPTYIDPSYVAAALERDGKIEKIRNKSNKESFLIYTEAIRDESSTVRGVIVAGESLKLSEKDLSAYLYFSILANVITTIVLTTIINKILKNSKLQSSMRAKLPGKIIFDLKSCSLTVDNIKTDIPFASNQFYLCKAIFSNPRKRYELDEILDKFGETDSSNWRTAYDTAIAVNKKAGYKIIEYKDKTFIMNPDISQKAQFLR